MTPTSIQSTISELEAIGDKNKRIEKALKDYLDNIQKRADKEKESINAILSILTGNAPEKSKKERKPKEKRIKLTDEEILEKVKEALSGGQKLSQIKILNKIGIQFPRFKKFIQNYPDLLGNEGKKRTSVFFLK